MLDIVVLGKKERERGKPVSYLLGPGWVTRCFSQKPWKGPSLVCHYKQSVLLILKSLTQFPPSYATLSSPGWHVLVFIFHSVRLSVSFNPVSLLCKVRFAAPSLPTPLPKTTALAGSHQPLCPNRQSDNKTDAVWAAGRHLGTLALFIPGVVHNRVGV